MFGANEVLCGSSCQSSSGSTLVAPPSQLLDTQIVLAFGITDRTSTRIFVCEPNAATGQRTARISSLTATSFCTHKSEATPLPAQSKPMQNIAPNCLGVPRKVNDHGVPAPVPGITDRRAILKPCEWRACRESVCHFGRPGMTRRQSRRATSAATIRPPPARTRAHAGHLPVRNLPLPPATKRFLPQLGDTCSHNKRGRDLP